MSWLEWDGAEAPPTPCISDAYLRMVKKSKTRKQNFMHYLTAFYAFSHPKPFLCSGHNLILSRFYAYLNAFDFFINKIHRKI